MSNWVVFFVICFISMQIMSLFMEGEVGLATSFLTSPISDTATTITVESTDGFMDADHIVINLEEICYTSKTSTTFDGLTRGCRDTDPANHAAGERVYNDTTGLINRMVGFNVLQSLADDGFVAGSLKFFTSIDDIAKAFWQMAIWDYSFLEGSLVWVKYIIFFPISAGLIFSLIQLVFRRG